MEVIIRAAPVSAVRKRLVRGGVAPAQQQHTTQPALAVPATVTAPAAAAPERTEEEKARAAEREVRMRLQMEQEVAAARTEAAQRGYADGLAKGVETAKAAVAGQLERLAAVIASLHQARSEVIDAASDTSVEIVYAAVCRILGVAAMQRDAVAGMVQQATSSFQHAGEIVVALHPQDLALVQELAQGLIGQPSDRQLRLRADAAILGGCVVEGENGTLDARLDAQLARLRETLLAVRKHRADDGGQP